MIKIPVYLRDMCDAKHLVQAASGCEKNVDLICGRYIVELGVEEEDEAKLRKTLESLKLIRE